MEAGKRPPEFTIDVFADPACIKDILKGILHMVFFHRIFSPIRPLTRDVLDTTLPASDDPDLETLIDQRAVALVRQIDSASPNGSNGRGQLVLEFLEKRRRKAYFFAKGDEEVCWERWILKVTLARPKSDQDAEKVRDAMESSLSKAAMKVAHIASEKRDHIPPITTSESMPFPYQILVNPRDLG